MVHFGGIVARDFVSGVIGDENAKRSSLNGQMSDDLGGGGSKQLTE